MPDSFVTLQILSRDNAAPVTSRFARLVLPRCGDAGTRRCRSDETGMPGNRLQGRSARRRFGVDTRGRDAGRRIRRASDSCLEPVRDRVRD